MTNRKLSHALKEGLKNQLGYSDEQFKIIEENPRLVDIIEAGPILSSKKIVATCIAAENCGMNKVGDRYVFTGAGAMIKDETCDTPCLWALSRFLPFSYVIYDRIASGLDASGMHFEYVSCPDTGCKFGGFGTAMFKISVE
jgi:hypothetical protein